MISAQDNDPIRRRLRGQFGLSSTAEDLREAAWQREAEFAQAVLRASAGGEVDSNELLDLGARCGLTPCQVYISLRAAEDAHKAWRASVHLTIFPLT